MKRLAQITTNLGLTDICYENGTLTAVYPTGQKEVMDETAEIEEEAVEIRKYLNSMVSKYRRLEQTALDQVALLQERRTALISAAVTGKIDLRGWQPPKREVAA